MSFADLFESLWAMLIDFINSFFAFVLEFVDGIMVPIAEQLPQLDYDTSFIVGVAWLANKFVALDYGAYLFISYCFTCLAILLVKWILALIPGMT